MSKQTTWICDRCGLDVKLEVAKASEDSGTPEDWQNVLVEDLDRIAPYRAYDLCETCTAAVLKTLEPSR